MSARSSFVVATAIAIAVVGCHAADSAIVKKGASPPDSAAQDTLPQPAPRPKPVVLSPLADSLSLRMTFVPLIQTWFAAAARGKHMVVDVGRYDIDKLDKDSVKLTAFRQAAQQLSPLSIGSRVRLYGPWGAEDGVVKGFEAYHNRILATLEVSPHLDSLARTRDPLAGSALRVDTAADAVRDTCARDSVPAALAARVAFVRDSISVLLRKNKAPLDRLEQSKRVASSQAIGCFGVGRVLLIVSLRAGDNEWVKEKILLIDPNGGVHPLQVQDFRFKAHDALYAMDGDGDGIDDLAAKAYTERAGATIILKLTDGKSLRRLASGFAWEVTE